MRKPLIYLFSVLSATSVAQAQVTDGNAAAPAEAAMTPIPIKAPDAAPEAPVGAGELTPSPDPIAPPIEGGSAGDVDVIAAEGVGTIEHRAAMASAGGRMVNDFHEEGVAAVLRLLARQAGINIVVSEQVVGTITMRLENLSPLEAIRVVVTAKNLLIDQQDSVYYIKTVAERASEATVSGHYTFSYASAENSLELLRSQLQAGVAPQVDKRTNTIYYRDFKSNMPNVALFLESVDRPTQQVMIEARLVEVNANPRQSYGINWAGTVGGSTNPQIFRYGGSELATYKIDNGRLVIDKPAAVGDTLKDFSLKGSSDLFNALSQQFAILTVPQMSATLRLLNEDADAEFIANPRIVTVSAEEAKIQITRNQPVPQLNFNEQTATAVFGGFEDVTFGNTLVVKPTVNKDDLVTLEVKPEISNKVADAVFTFASAEVSSPIIDVRSLESKVLIRSGDTLAIGGLLQDETTKNRTKVPILGDIPILGYAFQERVNSRVKRNLLVFVTPTVVQQGYGTGLEDQISGLKNSGEEYADPNGWRNNAKGAIRLIPTSNRPIASDYPKPGIAPSPNKKRTKNHRSSPGNR